VASTNPGVLVETAHAYGRHAWRVTIPPGTNAGFAIEMANTAAPPSLLAWTEPAIAAPQQADRYLHCRPSQG